MAGATAVYLKDTGHVLTSFTRNGAANGDFGEEELASLLSQKLILRNFPQSTLTPSSGAIKKPAPLEFEFEADELAAVGELLDSPIQDFVRSPRQFAVVEDAVEPVPSDPDTFTFVDLFYTLEADGIDITINTGSRGDITSDLAVSVLIRLNQSGGVFVRRTGKIVPSATEAKATGKVTFPTIPDGKHLLLLMIAGFRPIWDERQKTEDRTWTPS